MSKYHSKRTEIDGILFDSKKEAQRYQQLKLMERAGVICDLKRQVKYELIPSQYIGGKCVERAVTYISDFEYYVLKPYTGRERLCLAPMRRPSVSISLRMSKVCIRRTMSSSAN